MNNNNLFFYSFEFQESIAKTSEKVSEIDKIQIEEREKQTQQFKSEFYSMIQQTKDELEKIKGVEMKVEVICITN